MDPRTLLMDPVNINMKNLQKYGESGGKDMHGIVTDIKARELPYESAGEFSNAPFELNETAGSMWNDTQIIYYHASVENRFSENYLKLCGKLEKNIRKLGSICLTKAVLEQKGIAFPDLDGLSILELVKMVSFHWRKCHAAFRGIYYDNDLIGMSYLNWEFRWFDLGNRLKATEVKIDRIRSGKINADTILEQAEKFKGEPCSNDCPDRGIPQSLRMNWTALPIDSTMARDMLAREKEEEKAAEAARKREEEARKREEKAERALERDLWDSGFHPDIFNSEKSGIVPAEKPEEEVPAEEVPEAQDDVPPGCISEGEARAILIKNALKYGDHASLMAIPLEDTDTVHARWMRYIEHRESGPPDRR